MGSGDLGRGIRGLGRGLNVSTIVGALCVGQVTRFVKISDSGQHKDLEIMFVCPTSFVRKEGAKGS